MESAAPFDISFREDYVIATLRAERFSAFDEIQQLNSALGESLALGHGPNVLIDFRLARYVSSGLLGVVAAIASRVRSSGGEVHVLGLCDDLRDMFRQVLLDKSVTIHDAQDELIARLLN